jgi:hypothetical protein
VADKSAGADKPVFWHQRASDTPFSLPGTGKRIGGTAGVANDMGGEGDAGLGSDIVAVGSLPQFAAGIIWLCTRGAQPVNARKKPSRGRHTLLEFTTGTLWGTMALTQARHFVRIHLRLFKRALAQWCVCPHRLLF